MDLKNKIQRDQMLAGENAVVENLTTLGFHKIDRANSPVYETMPADNIDFPNEIQGLSDSDFNDFKKELASLINKYSLENTCDMPDFIMADMIGSFILTMGVHIKTNLDWHGCDSVCHPNES